MVKKLMETLHEEVQLKRFLNEMFDDTGSTKIVDACIVQGADRQSAMIVEALTNQGEELRVDFQFLAKEQSDAWSPSAWQPAMRSSCRRILVQIVDFICTKSEHAHSIYRFFERYPSEVRSVPGGRAAQLEVHVIELPKWTLLGGEHSWQLDQSSFANWFRAGRQLSMQ